jgi:hypothetical protein
MQTKNTQQWRWCLRPSSDPFRFAVKHELDSKLAARRRGQAHLLQLVFRADKEGVRLHAAAAKQPFLDLVTDERALAAGDATR